MRSAKDWECHLTRDHFSGDIDHIRANQKVSSRLKQALKAVGFVSLSVAVVVAAHGYQKIAQNATQTDYKTQKK